MKKSIQHTFHFACDAETVMKALTSEEQIQKWWTEDTKIEDGHGRFEWKELGWTVELDILVPDSPRLLRWKCTRSNRHDRDAWEGSTMRFVLFPDSYGTRVEFEHADYQPSPCFDASFAEWHHYLGGSLKSYLETGEGMPYKVYPL